MYPLRPLSPIALCSLYGPLPPLQSSVPLMSTVLSMALSLLYSRLSPSKALCPLFSPLYLSTIFCTLYGHMSSLQSSVPSMAHSSLYGPLSPLRPSVPPRPSVPSEKQRNKRNDPLASRNVFAKPVLSKLQGYRDLFCLSDNRDNHDHHSSEILSDNCEIAIITLGKMLR
jgi:hypothetical protein